MLEKLWLTIYVGVWGILILWLCTWQLSKISKKQQELECLVKELEEILKNKE